MPARLLTPFPFAIIFAQTSDDGEDEDQDSSESANSSSEEEDKPLPKIPEKKPAAAAAKDKSGGRNAKKKPAADEDIDAILEELNITPMSQPLGTSNASSSNSKSLLSVASAFLKSEDELKRMFGNMRGTGTEGEDPAAAYAGASRRVRRLAARGLLRPAHGALRPGVLITPRDTWPRPDGGVTLQSIEPDTSGHPTFQLAFTIGYQAVQDLYEECQSTFDPNAVAALLRSHPFHLDSLLTLADVYRSMGENTSADEMVERCVYALEMGWPPGFMSAAASGNARVVFEEKNESLFVALFRYIQSLGRRGLHRTALEVCKLLLQLDSDDPMGVLQTIDYFAVRSGQYEWLQKFVEGQGDGGDSAAALLPNMVFSLALARWYQEQHEAEKLTKKGNTTTASTFSSAPAESSYIPQPSSEELLAKAVLLHPLAITRLRSSLESKGFGRNDSRWVDTLSKPLLATATDGENPGLSHLIDIFVERQSDLWKSAPLQDWMLSGVNRACSLNAADLPNGLSSADWAAIRQQAFPRADQNAYSHLRVHDFSDSVPRLPPEEIHGMGAIAAMGGGHNGGGGIPEGMQEQLMADLARAEAELATGNADALRDMHPLVALLRSLMPWANEGQQPDYGAEEEEQRDQRQQ